MCQAGVTLARRPLPGGVGKTQRMEIAASTKHRVTQGYTGLGRGSPKMLRQYLWSRMASLIQTYYSLNWQSKLRWYILEQEAHGKLLYCSSPQGITATMPGQQSLWSLNHSLQLKSTAVAPAAPQNGPFVRRHKVAVKFPSAAANTCRERSRTAGGASPVPSSHQPSPSHSIFPLRRVSSRVRRFRGLRMWRLSKTRRSARVRRGIIHRDCSCQPY